MHMSVRNLGIQYLWTKSKKRYLFKPPLNPKLNMTEEKLVCGATRQRITNDPGRSMFPCPKCGKETIIRGSQARKLAMKYKCSACGFEGPN